MTYTVNVGSQLLTKEWSKGDQINQVLEVFTEKSNKQVIKHDFTLKRNNTRCNWILDNFKWYMHF